MSTTDPKRKIERSRNFTAGYAASNVLHSEPAIDSVISDFLGHLDSASRSHSPMDLAQFFTFTAFDIIGEILFSSQFGFLASGKDLGNAVANSRALMGYVSVMGFFRWVHVALFGNPLMTWLKVLPYGHLFDTTVRALDRRLRDRRDDSRFDMLEHWVRTMEKHPDRLGLRDVYAMATGVVGAASDTVSCTMQSFVYYMLRTPGAWERARREIEEAHESHGICGDKIVAFADAQKLPYLQACLKEGLRVFSPAAMTLARVARKGGVTIGERHFREGTILSINPWVMHLSKEIWGPDAREFNPDRWLREDAASFDKWFMPVS